MPAIARACALLLGLLVLHLLDHSLRQDRPVPSELGIFGALGFVAPAIVLGLAFTRRRQTAPAALLVGLALALGFVAVHLLPRWGAFSDPYPGANLDAISWASMLGSLAAGLVLAAAGLRASGARGRPATS